MADCFTNTFSLRLLFGHSSIGFFLRSFAALLEEESIAKRADFEIVILCTDR